MEASEAAYELNHMLREQLQLLMRERDLASNQVCMSMSLWETLLVHVSIYTSLGRRTEGAVHTATS